MNYGNFSKKDMVRFPGGYATITDGLVTFHYYTQDYLGSNRAVVNGSTGAIEQTVAYYPYGSVIADLGTGSDRQPFKFGGKELTLQNGLNEYDFGARQYYPAVPHFTGVDPLCEKYYWLSPYLYCANNPVNAVDPDGKETTLWATRLPGAPSWLGQATHTFITVTPQNGKTKYFAYGSNYDGAKGLFLPGRLTRRQYDHDKAIYSGKNDNPELLKAKISIQAPDGMSQEDFDRKVIEVAESFGEQEGIEYSLLPWQNTEGNCNSSTSTILVKAGVDRDAIDEIGENMPGINWGFGNVKPWTKEEQSEAIRIQQEKSHQRSILNETLEQSLH